MAPEIHEGKKYSGSAADIFSAAVVLFAMVAGGHPFEKATMQDSKYLAIAKQEAEAFWDFFEQDWPKDAENPERQGPSQELKDLLTAMMQYDPLKRPSLSDIFFMPWLKDFQPLNYEELSQLMSGRMANSK